MHGIERDKLIEHGKRIGTDEILLTKYLETLLLTQEQKLFLRINNLPMNYTSPSLDNLRNAKYIHLFETTLGVLIL